MSKSLLDIELEVTYKNYYMFVFVLYFSQLKLNSLFYSLFSVFCLMSSCFYRYCE